jgi:hypothetical protein
MYEHCDKDGNRAPGAFDERHKLNPDTVSQICAIFIDAYWKLCTDGDGNSTLPDKVRARQMLKAGMSKYARYWRDFRSNKTCFGCLQEAPDHILRCGHAFCAPCVQEIGKASEFYEYAWVVHNCILCQSYWHDHAHLFRLHPPCAGVRALSLDGGGVRGIVEISLLEKLDAAIDLDLPLRHCFDIIVGTSTGKS